MSRPTWRELFWTRIEVTGFCWNWTGTMYRNGYGTLGRDNKRVLAHRVSYELLVGPIPEGMTLDHLCRNRACVNPDHLDVCGMWENVSRGYAPASINARKTHCKRNHEFTPENTYHPPGRPGQRHCRTCLELYRPKKNAARRTGRSNRGENSGHARLTEDQVREIRRLRQSGELVKTIARKYSVSAATITDIANGRTWSWLT